jgi:hypothetical protein
MGVKRDDVAALAELLAKKPLYSQITVALDFEGKSALGFGLGQMVWIKIPQAFRIDLHCPNSKCDRERTFMPLGGEWPEAPKDPRRFRDAETWRFRVGLPMFLSFTCTGCIVQTAVFALMTEQKGLGEAVLQKVGHGPGSAVRVDPRVAKAMGPNVGLYRKGLESEFHSFGIGAYGYFRQVAENIVDRMLKTLRAEAHASGDTELCDAIDGLDPKAPASARIAIVKDHLPATLRPGGSNPLGAIYKVLSQGIHAGADEECLEQATELRIAMTYLVQELAERREKREAYVAAVRELSAPK